MQPKHLLAIFAFAVVLIVLILYLISDDEAFLEPDNTGPPEVTRNTGPGSRAASPQWTA